MTKNENALKKELLRLMPVQSDGDWGPQPIICRWCGCWLEYTDSSPRKPVEAHKEDCFAVIELNRPARK